MFRTLLGIIGILVFIALLYVFIAKDRSPLEQQAAAPLNINLQDIKPTPWVPIEKDGLIEISIDGDSGIEWLLLYRDEGDTNQIGGIIYDAQNHPKDVAGMSALQQSPAYLIPYRLMPDYTLNKSHGYLGDESVVYQTVAGDGADASSETKPQDDKVLTGDYLQIRGNARGVTNRFSVFWWLGVQQGYGGALAYTPGYFSLSQDSPDDWQQWQDGDAGKTKLITELWSWEPQMDRSNICRRAAWRLEGDRQQNTLQFVGDYENSDLVFCRGSAPQEPAFPEAQVLAYLLDKNANRWLDDHSPVSYDNVSVRKISAPEITTATTDVGVQTQFVADGASYSLIWRVELEPSQELQSPAHWRIVSVSSP